MRGTLRHGVNRLATPRPALWVGALLALMAASLLLRTGALDAGYWIDEGISVGIASHDLRDIPGALGQDGNPPLYYLLLHGWMQIFGTTEAATRALSLLFALLAIPASFWAGTRLFSRRAGVIAAAGAAGAPFLTYYAQETRMYSLVVLLSILASASFALAFVRSERKHVVYLGVWLALLLYTHTWGVFLVVAMSAVWLHLRRRGEVDTRDGVRLLIVLAVAYLPWLPVILFQAQHTAAPWAERPSPLVLLIIPGGLFGHIATPLLAIAVFFGAAPPPAGGPRGADAARDRDRHGAARLAVLADRARLGHALLGRADGPAAARAGLGGVPRAALDGARAGRRRRRVGDERPAGDQEQRAHRLDHHRPVDPAGRPRRLHPARDRARAAPLPARGRRLPHADGARERPAPDRLARRPAAAAQRPGGDAAAAGDRHACRAAAAS